MNNERALTMRFFRHGGIYRSDVSLPLVNLGRGIRLPAGLGPGYRTRREEHALSIARDEFRPAIPRSDCSPALPSPLHRHHQNKAMDGSKGTIYHRTLCIDCRTSPVYLNFARDLSIQEWLWLMAHSR
jgi:hypothetical protein